MNKVSVHSTKEEYEALDADILAGHIAEVSTFDTEGNMVVDQYNTQTSKWAEPTQKTNGDWTAPMCHHYDYAAAGITVEDYDSANYPAKVGGPAA